MHNIHNPNRIADSVNTKLESDGILAWTQSDIENRVGFKAGRHTGVNHFLALIVGVLLAAVVYSFMAFVLRPLGPVQFIAEMFLRPGNQFTMIPATLFFCWGAAVLLIKSSKIRFQGRALNLQPMPDDPEFVLNESTAAAVLKRINEAVDHPRHFILLNRIENALANLRNIGQIGDVSSILRSQAENDENQVASSYTLLNGMVWAIPVLGFIGTVQGLSMAIGGFTKTLQAAGDLSQIRASLQGVTSGLSTAFETTLIALIYALVLQLWITFQQRREMSLLDACNDYCHTHVVSRLRLLDREPNRSP
ncbi:MAG: MotA/TolQ/ExbB proton channel family protein [Limisphaerales bacterium]